MNIYHHKCVFLSSIQEMDVEMDMEYTPLKCKNLVKDQQAYNMINVCEFVNTIQKEIEMEMHLASSQPLTYHLRDNKPVSL